MGLSEIEFLLKGLAYLLPLFVPSAVKQKRNCYSKVIRNQVARDMAVC